MAKDSQLSIEIAEVLADSLIEFGVSPEAAQRLGEYQSLKLSQRIGGITLYFPGGKTMESIVNKAKIPRIA